MLTDRRGEQFPVLCAYGCRCEIENGKTLVLGGQAGGVPVRPAVRTPAVYHRDGGGVARRFSAPTGPAAVTADDNSTRGLFYRGVE